MTRVHATDGSLVAEYARERRLVSSDPGGAEARDPCLPLGRGQELLRAWRARFHGHGARRHPLRAAIRHRPPSPGRLHDHPAGGEELPAHQRSVVHPQDHRSAAVDEDRARLYQGQDSRTLSQRDLSRLLGLRHRGRLASVFRQVGARTDDRGSGLSRRAAEGTLDTASVPPARARHRAPQLRHRSHGREWLRQGRGRRRRQEDAACGHRAHDRFAHLCRRIFRRRGAPRNLRSLWREEALRGRIVGAHHARSEAAAARPQGACRRHDPL